MEISIAAEALFHLFGFPITNSFLLALLVTALLVGTLVLFRKDFSEVPRGFQNVIESVFEAILSLIEGVTGNRQEAEKIFPLAATIFLFVLCSNWAGLIPGAGTIGLAHTSAGHATVIPFVRSASADLNMTIALSLIVVFTIQWSGIVALGLRGYAGKFLVAPWKKPYMIGTIVGLLELIGEIAKILSFSFRLFGNVFAGEVLLAVMLHLVPFFVPLPFLMLEVFVGLIQAAVFSLLTVVFMKMATVPHTAH